MQPGPKLLATLAAAAAAPLLAAFVLLRPAPGTALLLTLAAVAGVAAARAALGPTVAPSAAAPLGGPPGRRGTAADPDRVVDRVVASLEEYVSGLLSTGARPEAADVRQEVGRRVGRVLQDVSGLPVGGEAREVTVLLSDLRGFSVITETYAAREVVDMLNRYFARMCEIVCRNGGSVDKFMGDSIMALFGAPVTRPDDIQRAACCAVEMQLAMDDFNKENETLGMPNLYMGIGINTGQVVAGKIGSDLHSEYTVIGDEVNLASRIEAYTLRGQILISQNTWSRLQGLLRVKEPIYVSVKGKREAVPLYELLGVGAPFNLEVPEREVRRSLRVDVNIPFRFQVCEGKVVCSDQHEGRILNLSAGGMFAATTTPIEPFFNIKFALGASVLGIESGDVYGKVLRVKRTAELYEMNMEFTAIEPRDRNAIKDLVNRIVDGTFSPG